MAPGSPIVLEAVAVACGFNAEWGNDQFQLQRHGGPSRHCTSAFALLGLRSVHGQGSSCELRASSTSPPRSNASTPNQPSRHLSSTLTEASPPRAIPWRVFSRPGQTSLSVLTASISWGRVSKPHCRRHGSSPFSPGCTTWLRTATVVHHCYACAHRPRIPERNDLPTR